MYVRFQYARKFYECNECGEKIRVGALVSFYQQKWHHFDCFFEQRAVDEFRKSEIMIWLKRSPINNRRRTVSLQGYDRHSDKSQLEITLTELTKIREQFALAKEHKTESYIPWASRTANLNCHDCIFARSNSVVGGEQLGISFLDNNYHPECLLKTGIIRDYDSLSEDDKKLLDELYKKDNASYLLPKAETTSFIDEIYFCAAPECHSQNGYKIEGLRIRYQTKTYHPGCLAAMGKFNIDGEEIEYYHTLGNSLKERLRTLFKKSNDFDIPLIEEAKRDDYCTLADCPAANGQPSKFPWPYTIKFGQLQIKFHGDIYHPKCFKSSQIVNMDVKDFRGYDSLSQRTKQMIEETFKDTVMEEGEQYGDGSDSSDFESDQMDDDNDIEGPPAKKSKMEPQMQDENVSNENIQNEFDNDQEPFDGTNIKEEMSEPIVSQINTLNELNNTQTVNDREEREGNQESGDLVVENVVSGNEMEDVIEIPVIKKELEGEPEIITLDDEVETNVVQPEIKQESVAESYRFDVPTGDFLRSTLGKFDIDISNEVYTFYGNKIKYTEIPTTATVCATFPISSSTDSFFKCLSLYFTGKEEHFSNIKMGIQAYFYNKSKTFGTGMCGIPF
uniref:Uncharacterized protein n=1 Tax=Panagrolaimus davidi TaxID=227884 RepID=A0A914R8W8_9BILA